MGKTGFSILLFLLIMSQNSYSQSRNELYKKSEFAGSVFITGLGPAYCFGDIGGALSNQILFGANDWDVDYTRYLFSIGYRQEFKSRFGFKVTRITLESLPGLTRALAWNIGISPIQIG